MNNKRIVLTGVTGFLGSHLAVALGQCGFDIIGLKRKTSSLHRLPLKQPWLSLIDVEEINFDTLFTDYGHVDVIVHTATNYGRNNESVWDVFVANTEFPLRLLDAGVRHQVPGFINTDTILDKHLNVYAFSKNQLLQWGDYFSKKNEITFLNLRLEHFYGPGDDASKFTEYIIRSCLNNVSEIPLTTGEQRRDFVYIDDVVSAYVLLVNQIKTLPAKFNQFEIGSGSSISIKDFATLVKLKTSSSTNLLFGALPYRENEVMFSVANIGPLVALGWSCKNDISTGISKLLAYEGF